VREKEYQVELSRAGKPEDEKFEPFRVTVEGQVGGEVTGTLKLTPRALEVAGERASKDGGSSEEWLVRGCARSLASEVLIRKLKPDFSFVVDERWIKER
jgi:hypothetical protein